MFRINKRSIRTALIRLTALIAVAAVTAFICQPIYMAGGECDFWLLALLIGIPFGIQKITLWFVPFGYGIAGTLAIPS